MGEFSSGEYSRGNSPRRNLTREDSPRGSFTRGNFPRGSSPSTLVWRNPVKNVLKINILQNSLKYIHDAVFHLIKFQFY